MARWFVNPRKRHGRKRGHGGQHRPRVRVSGHRFLLGVRSPYKGRIHRVNPIIHNPIIHNPFVRGISMFGNPRHHRRHHRRHHYHHNPIIRNPGMLSGVTHAIRDPMALITQGGVGATSAFLTIALSNTVQGMIGNMFMGADIVSKLVRGIVRAGVGGLVYWGLKSVMPRQANAAIIGVSIAAGGGFLFDLLGTRVVVGVGDTAQTPGMLFAGVGNLGAMFSAAPAVAGYGAYVRPMGAYVRPMGRVGYRGFDGIYGPGSMNALQGAGGDSIYG